MDLNSHRHHHLIRFFLTFHKQICVEDILAINTNMDVKSPNPSWSFIQKENLAIMNLISSSMYWKWIEVDMQGKRSCLKWFPYHCLKLFLATYISALELIRQGKLALQIFLGKTLLMCLPEVISTQIFHNLNRPALSDSLQCIHQVTTHPSPANCYRVIYTNQSLSF